MNILGRIPGCQKPSSEKGTTDALVSLQIGLNSVPAAPNTHGGEEGVGIGQMEKGKEKRRNKCGGVGGVACRLSTLS